jgi:cobalt-zinc-cadmium efflux system outer membrane protein
MKEGIESGKSTFFEKRYTISQSLDFPLKSLYNYNAYSDEITSLELNYESKKKDLIVDVKSSYVNVLAAIAGEELREQQLELSQNLFEAVNSRVEAGVSSELELLKASIKLDESKNELDDANQEYHQARYSLFNIVGLDPDEQSYSISFEDTLRYKELDLDQEEILELIPNQYEILSIDSKISSANQKVNSSWSNLLPKLNFSYYLQDIGTGFDYHGYEIGLSIPVWFMINEGQDIKIANTEMKLVEWEKQEAILRLKKEIEVSWHSFETSRKSINRYEQGISKRAKELLDLTLEGYQLGSIDLLNLLYAQETYLSSQIGYIQALKNYYIKIIELEKYLDNELVF